MTRDPLTVRLYRALLRCYPPALRRAHGEEMVEVVRRRWEETRGEGAARRLAFHLRTWGDALLHCGAAWVRAVGGLARGGEGSRAPRGLRGMASGAADVARELRLAVRSLLRTPGFTAAVILTLALGIGANTAIFSIVRTVLLEPLPYPDSDRLVVADPYPWTYTEIVLDAERSGGVFEEVAGFYPRAFSVTGGEEAVEVEGARVTHDFFDVLGAEFALGREFTEADARADAPPTAVLGHDLWRRRYGASPDVLGQSVRVDGRPHEIVGVTAPGFRQLAPRSDDPQLWIPFALEPTRAADGSFTWAIPVGRLREGMSVERAVSELTRVMERFRERHPEAEEGIFSRTVRWTLLRDDLVRDVRPALLVLQAAVVLVLILALVNVANLLLVRLGGRGRELAVRTAMGASRGRLLRQLLVESTVLALAGGVAGLALLFVGLDLVLAIAPAEVPRIDRVSVDGPVLLFTLGISLATGLLFGVVPALASSRRPPHEVLRTSGRSTTGSKRKHRVSQGLVVAQVTLALVLLVGAGLLVRSFLTLTGREPGFRTEGVLAASIHVSRDRYDSVPELEAFYRRVRERLARVPGVRSAAVTNNLPIQRGSATRTYRVEGEEGVRVAQYGVVSPGYFRTLGIPVLRGRAFRASDRRGAPRVVVIDETLGREVWPDRDPVGRRVRFEEGEEWLTVVGVVAESRGSGLAEPPRPGFYIPYEQRPATGVELAVGRNAVLLVRSRAGVEELAGPLREAVWEVEPRQPVAEVATLESLVREEVAPQRFRALLLGTFAGVALVLVVAGIYGVVAYVVAERTHEFGIRVAMGATDGDIVRRVLGWGLGVTGMGVALGMVGVLGVSRYLESFLVGIAPSDPLTFVAAAAVIVLATLAACLVPARRATRADPVRALRAEGGPSAGAAAGLLLVVVGAALSGCGETEAAPGGPRFEVHTVDVGSPTSTVLLSDVNRDGRLDALLTGGESVHVLLGDGRGGLEVRQRVPAGESPADLASGDFDGDGWSDLAVANHDTDYVTLLFGGGDGFLPARTGRIDVGVSPHPHAVAVADVDGDGHDDILVDDRGGSALRVLRGRGDGGFVPGMRVAVGGDPYRGMAVADLDGDGVPDVATPNPRSVGIALGLGSGAFAPPSEVEVRGLRPFGVAVADVDEDGVPDLGVGSGEEPGAFAIRLGRGDGSFVVDPSSPYRVADGPTRVSSADVDGDGVDDFVVASYTGGGVALVLGGADGRRVVRLELGLHPWDVAAGDLDGDGRTDLVVADDGRPEILVLLQR